VRGFSFSGARFPPSACVSFSFRQISRMVNIEIAHPNFVGREVPLTDDDAEPPS
jgi:hypothetical protein